MGITSWAMVQLDSKNCLLTFFFFEVSCFFMLNYETTVCSPSNTLTSSDISVLISKLPNDLNSALIISRCNYFLMIKFFSGTPALTTRGMKETDIDEVVNYIDKALKLAQEVTKISGPKLVDFNKALDENPDFKNKVAKLKGEIESYSKKFPLPGFDTY